MRNERVSYIWQGLMNVIAGLKQNVFGRYDIIDKNGKSLKFMMKNERDCGRMIDNQVLSIELVRNGQLIENYLSGWNMNKAK